MASQRELRRVMFDAARAACKVAMRHFGRVRSIERKDDAVSLVTAADREADRAIVREIRRAFPDHAILAEESGESGGRSEYLWVIDPIDGTTNFAHGVPIFAVSIALQRDDETVMGLVVDPTRDEWFFARRGGGASLNRRRLCVSDTKRVADVLAATGFPHARRENVEHLLRIVGAGLMKAHGVIRLGAAALDLCYVAAGRVDAFWEERLSPWDVAAGVLIVEEAGGRCTGFDGKRSTIHDASVLASNGHVHRGLLRVIRDNWAPW